MVSVFTYTHVRWFYGQLERAYYLNYFIKKLLLLPIFEMWWSVRENLTIYEIKTAYHGKCLNVFLFTICDASETSLVRGAHSVVFLTHRNSWIKIVCAHLPRNNLYTNNLSKARENVGRDKLFILPLLHGEGRVRFLDQWRSKQNHNFPKPLTYPK